MKHTCHAKNCTAEVPPRLFMCKPHWRRLPKHLQDAIWEHYEPGQEVRKDPSREYLSAADDAVKWLAEKEAEDQAKRDELSRQGELGL